MPPLAIVPTRSALHLFLTLHNINFSHSCGHLGSLALLPLTQAQSGRTSVWLYAWHYFALSVVFLGIMPPWFLIPYEICMKDRMVCPACLPHHLPCCAVILWTSSLAYKMDSSGLSFLVPSHYSQSMDYGWLLLSCLGSLFVLMAIQFIIGFIGSVISPWHAFPYPPCIACDIPCVMGFSWLTFPLNIGISSVMIHWILCGLT